MRKKEHTVCVANHDFMQLYIIPTHDRLLGAAAGRTALPCLGIPFIKAANTTTEESRQPQRPGPNAAQ